jgi:hypothetical protein
VSTASDERYEVVAAVYCQKDQWSRWFCVDEVERKWWKEKCVDVRGEVLWEKCRTIYHVTVGGWGCLRRNIPACLQLPPPGPVKEQVQV